MRTALLTLLAVLAPMPVVAQEWQVARQNFGFATSRLTIHVDAEVAGTLRLIRGGYGHVSVASRTDRGFTTAGLADGRDLTLTATGPGAVDYLVAVPEDVWVRVRLPGTGFAHSVPRHARSHSFEWPAVRRVAHTAVGEWMPPLEDDGALYTTFSRDLAPAVVSLPDLANVRSLTVRIEEGPFRTLTSRPLSVDEGDPDRVEIRPAAPAMDIVLTVPTGTRGFRLEAGGETALLVDGESVTALCSPLTQQWLSNGQRWVTFNPVDGALDCSATSAPRHEG